MTAEASDAGRSVDLRVTYRDLKRFALRSAMWVALVVVPAMALTYLVSSRSPRLYLAEATVLAPLQAADIDSIDDTPTATLPLAPTAYEAALSSDEVIIDALRRLDAAVGSGVPLSQATRPPSVEGVNALRDDTSFRFEESRRSTLLMIGAHASTASAAAAKANALTGSLVAWDDARARAEAASHVATLELQLAALESQLAELRSLGNRAATPQLNSVSLLAADVRAELAVARSLAVAARGNLEVLQGASRATQLRPSPLVNSVVVAALGTLLVMTVLLVRAAGDQTVNGEDGLEAVTGLPVLARFDGGSRPELPYLKAHIDRALPDGGSVLVIGVVAGDDSDTIARALTDSYDLPGSATFINDSPAVLASAAAVDRTAVYDVVVLVADPLATNRIDLREALVWLRRADANVLGIVAAPRVGSVRAGATGGRRGGPRRSAALGAQRSVPESNDRPNTGLGAR